MDRSEMLEQIIQVSDRLFRRYGPLKTPVRLIARELNMSPANVYKYYPTKNAIIEAVVERQLEGLKATILESCAASDSAFGRIRRLAYCVMRYFEETIEKDFDNYNTDITLDLIRFETSGPRNTWKFIKNFHAFLHARIVEALRLGVASGELQTDDPEDTAGGVLDCLSRVIEPILLLEDPHPVRVERLERLLRVLELALLTRRDGQERPRHFPQETV